MHKYRITKSIIILGLLLLFPQLIYAFGSDDYYDVQDFIADTTIAECSSSIGPNDSGLVGVFRISEVHTILPGGDQSYYATVNSVIIKNVGTVSKTGIDTVVVRYEQKFGGADYNGDEIIVDSQPGAAFSENDTMLITISKNTTGSGSLMYLYVIYYLKNAIIGDTADVSCIAGGLSFNNAGNGWQDNGTSAYEPDAEINSPGSRAVISSYTGPWYVNDNDQTGDLYTTAVGDDGNLGRSDAPFLTIGKALATASAGDTIYIDAGTYSETVVIDTNNISLIGADSSTTIIDPPGDSSVAGLFGISASGKNNLTIKNLKITDCQVGIYFLNIDTSTLDNITVYKTGASSGSGISLCSGCESNTIQNCLISENYYGLFLNLNNNSNCIMNNYILNNSFQGLLLSALCNGNVITGNTISNNNNYGLRIYNSTNNVIKNNTSSYNFLNGYFIEYSQNNILIGNIADNNFSAGF